MSHFTAIVVIEKTDNEIEIEARVATMLDPYNVEDHHEEYIYKTAAEVKEKLAEFQNEALHEPKSFAYKIQNGLLSSGMKIDLFKISIADFALWYYDNEVDEDGNVIARGNPIAKWDYWDIGGRWDGRMIDPEGMKGELIKNNVLPTEDLLTKDFFPSAIVTPKEGWSSIDENHGLSMFEDEEAENQWREKYRTLLKAYPNHLAVLCDLHI